MSRPLPTWLRHAFLLFALVLLLAGCGAGGPAPPAAANGVLDLRQWDFGRDGIASLDGQWQLQWDEFGDPRQPAPPDARLVQVPGSWNELAGRNEGRATYRLTVQCHRGGGLALSLPVQHSAARWFVNGALVARQGEPGASKRGARAEPVQQIVALDSVACPLNIVAHVSNFDMPRGGLMRAVELGEIAQVVNRRESALVRDLLTIGGLVVLGVLPLLFYLGLRGDDRSPLWFGLFCLSFALGMALANTRVLQPVIAPFGWDRYLQVVMLSWCAVTVLFALFVRSLYPDQVSARALKIILGWAGATSVVVLSTSSALFSYLAYTVSGASLLIVGYVAWGLVVAWRSGRRTARVLLFGLVVMVAAIACDSANFAHLTRMTLVPYGVMVFVAAPAYLMARRFTRALLLEERLAIEQRERADLIVRSTQAGVLDWDAIGGRVTLSDRYREMLGFGSGPDAPEPPPLRELLHPDEREAVYGSFLAQLRDRTTRSGVRVNAPSDFRIRAAGGAYLWVHAESVSVHDAHGRTLRYITSLIDISDRKLHEAEMGRQQEALRAQVELTRTEQRRLDLVVRGARVGIVDWDGQTHATWYSPRFREIRGYASDADTADWPDYFKVMIHPDDRQRVTRRWVAFIRGQGPEGPHGDYYAPEEYRLLRADGSYVWVQVSGIAVRDAQGFVLRWIAAIIDITERRAQEEALLASNEALKENVRLREEVERIGRHDIKTPLNTIVSVPRLLREERRLGPEADELLGIVERAGYRILSMVNLSLDLYKMEQGSYVFRPDAVDLADLVDKVLMDVRVHAASKGVRFDADLAGAPYAWAEELLCYSLLANLTKNAVEASPEGGVVTLRAERGEGDTVRLHVSNRGAVPAAIRGSFFQKYATLGKASGTGLGTYSARLMARVQDGDIAMQTSDAEGTTLSVTLRAAPSGVIPASVRHAVERQRGEPLRLGALPAARVLLVDDDEYNLLIVRRFLPAPPFTVETAINGRMALASAEREWPAIVFMDLDMPVMGGLEAVRALRELEAVGQRPRCTMIALSSHEDLQTQQAALAAGFDRYLSKPVTREVLQRVLLEFLAPAAVLTPPGSPPAPAPGPAAATDPVLVDADIESMVGEFIADRAALVLALPAQLAAGERDALRRSAHLLAGSLGLYGFRWASEQCRWIERNHAEVDALRLAELVAQLQQHLLTADIRFVPVDTLPEPFLEQP